MKKNRVFRIEDAVNGVLYCLLFIHTIDIGLHQMSCVRFNLCSSRPAGYVAGRNIWDRFVEVLARFLEANPEDIIYFCHYDNSKNLAKLLIFSYRIRQYMETHEVPVDIMLCRGTDTHRKVRHIMVGLNRKNSDLDALKSVIEENISTIIDYHSEEQENGVLRHI